MDLKQACSYRIEWLDSFVAVAHHGGFSAAAKVLFRSQPRISSHVADFEHALGARLFDRTVQPARLTTQGQALLPHAEDLLHRLNMLADVVNSSSCDARGTVRVGSYVSAATHLWPWLVRRLRRRSPAVNPVLREGTSLELSEALSRGDIDLAIRPLLPLTSDRRLASDLLWREPLLAVFALNHPLAETSGVRMSQLASLPLLTVGQPGEDSRQYEAHVALASAGIKPSATCQTNESQTLVALARDGLGVGVANGLAMTAADTEGVSLVPILDARCERQAALWWRCDQPLTPAAEEVRAAISAAPFPVWPWEAYMADDRSALPRLPRPKVAQVPSELALRRRSAQIGALPRARATSHLEPREAVT